VPSSFWNTHHSCRCAHCASKSEATRRIFASECVRPGAHQWQGQAATVLSLGEASRINRTSRPAAGALACSARGIQMNFLRGGGDGYRLLGLGPLATRIELHQHDNTVSSRYQQAWQQWHWELMLNVIVAEDRSTTADRNSLTPFSDLAESFHVNSVALVRERTTPTERPPLVGEVSASFCGQKVPRGQRNGAPRPYSRLPLHCREVKKKKKRLQSAKNVHCHRAEPPGAGSGPIRRTFQPSPSPQRPHSDVQSEAQETAEGGGDASIPSDDAARNQLAQATHSHGPKLRIRLVRDMLQWCTLVTAPSKSSSSSIACMRCAFPGSQRR
jgi:hypothetical protein